MTEYIYHGRKQNDGGKWTNSLNGVIEGAKFSIYEIDPPDPEIINKSYNGPLKDVPGGIAGQRDVWVTGGLTEHLGAAIKFHQAMSVTGAVFIIDRHRLPGRQERIQYDFEWASDRPGTYARVDSIDEWEAYYGDELVAAGYMSAETDEPYVTKWGDRVKGRIDDFHYADEAEVYCHDCREIDFTSALYGTASYFNGDTTSGRSLQQTLSEQDGYGMNWTARDEKDVQEMTLEEMAEAYHDIFMDTVPSKGSVISRSHMIVVYERDRDWRVKDATQMIPDGRFRFAYDGNTFYTDPGEVRPYLGG